MAKPIKDAQIASNQRLTASERNEIELKIQFEISKSFHNMVKLGALANIIGGLLYVITIYSTTRPMLIIGWYCTLVAANLLNIRWALFFEYKNISQKEVHKCRQGFIYILMIICLIWSCIGILFMDDGTQQQMATIIFLLAVLICFLFSTVIDLTMGIISILFLLIPPIIYHLYLAINVFPINTEMARFNISFVAAFVVLGFFMFIVCIAGNKVIIKVFRLGYENLLLNKKIGAMNILLEQRVKERTQELEESLKLVTYQSTHDLLTELPNERLLLKTLGAATEKAGKAHYKFALACFSLNNMVKVRDSIGHEASTKIIHRISQRFAHFIGARHKYFVSLSRQDVFVILIEQVGDDDDIKNYMNELFSVLQEPVFVEKHTLKLTGSIGVSLFPEHGRDVDSLITNAEAARVLASQIGGNSYRIYTTVINADASRLFNIENQLYHAIDNNELLLNYQPYINLITGEVCGAEALIRWNSPLLGLVSPMDFIPIAETNGMIIPIGEWVLRTACTELKKWHDNGFDEFKLSVNLSAKQLVQQNLIDYIVKILDELKLEPKYLDLELTESNAFHKEVLPIISRFTELGISLSIDDFGTGYSEFSSLKLFKVDKIKIDKSFIQDIEESVDSRSIVSNTIALANSMNLKCLAEGVETIEQLNFLRNHGCYIIQGYYYSKPLDSKDFFEFMKAHSKKT